jgi:hypothetical protein
VRSIHETYVHGDHRAACGPLSTSWWKMTSEVSSRSDSSSLDALPVRWRRVRLSFIETLLRADHVGVTSVERQRVATCRLSLHDLLDLELPHLCHHLPASVSARTIPLMMVRGEDACYRVGGGRCRIPTPNAQLTARYLSAFGTIGGPATETFAPSRLLRSATGAPTQARHIRRASSLLRAL